jgi:hypothetical protein
MTPQPRLCLPAVSLALALAGCGAADIPAPATPPAIDECGASALGQFVNQTPTDATMMTIRSTIAHGRIRTIRPGDMVTLDFRADRLNVEIGADGRIKLFRCG